MEYFLSRSRVALPQSFPLFLSWLYADRVLQLLRVSISAARSLEYMSRGKAYARRCGGRELLARDSILSGWLGEEL